MKLSHQTFPADRATGGFHGTQLSYLFLLFCILVAVFGTVSAATAPERKEVLYINSYSKGLEWSDPITQAVEDRMRTSGYDVNLHIEYMDEKRYQDRGV